jgi:hypothetical protein
MATGVAVALVLGTAFAVLRIKLEGADLGDTVASLLNQRMRGRISVGSIEWSTSSLQYVVTGGWAPVTVRDVRVWDDCALSAAVAGPADEALRTGDPNEDCTPDDHPDPDPASRRKPRKLLLATERITLELDVHALLFGNHNFVFRNVWIHGGEALIEQTTEPYPLHAYNRTIVSIVTAFYPRMKASFRAGIYADAPPPIFDLRDIHIAGLNLTLHMAPGSGDKPERIRYGFTARLEGVEVDAGPDPANSSYLYADPTDPLVAKLYVLLAVTARHASVRILDEGPRAAFRLPWASATPAGAIPEVEPFAGRTAAYALALADIKLDRLAQLPTSWARGNFVANTLEVDLRARTLPCQVTGAAPPDPKDGAGLHLSGELFNFWDRPYDGAWNLQLVASNLGPTVRSCIKPMIGGEHLDGTISLTGPFVAQPAVGLDLTGVDIDVPLRKDEAPLRLTVAELHGKIDLVNEEGYIEKTKALVRGGKEPGEVELSATFGLKPLYTNAQVEIVKPIDVRQFLPAAVTTPIGSFLQGRLRVISATVEDRPAGKDTVVELSDFDLALGATARDRALRLHRGRLFTDDNFDSIRIDKVHLEAGTSRAVFDGKVDIARNDMNVKVVGDFPDLGVWLRRFGVPALATSAGAGGTITLTGKPTNPTITVTDTMLSGVPCLDKLELVRLTKSGDAVDVQEVRSPGLGGQLSGSGRLVLGGKRPVIERLDLVGTGLDAARLCGLRGIVEGKLNEARVHVHGDIDPRRSPLDWLALGDAYVRADHLTIRGDRYSSIKACVNRKDDRMCRARPAAVVDDDRTACEDAKRAGAAGGAGFCVVASADRDAGGVPGAGGTLDATIAQLPGVRTGGRTAAPPRLAGAVTIANLPLTLIDQLRGHLGAPTVGGIASTTLRLAGTAAAPQASGKLQLLRSWLAGGFLGDPELVFEPATVRGVPGVAFHGSALAGRLTISGSLGTAAPFPIELVISGHRVEIDPFIDLQALVKLPDPIQAWASGTITVRSELAPAGAAEPQVWIELTELTAKVDHRSSDGRITPLVIRVKDQDPAVRAAMSVYVTRSSIELACREPRAVAGRAACATVLTTPAGDVVIRGTATQGNVAITASGDLDLSKLRGLLEQRFDYVAGTVRLLARISGTFAKPAVEVALELDPEQVSEPNAAELAARRAAQRAKQPRTHRPLQGNPVVLRPVGTDTVLTAPRGLIKLANGVVGFTDVLLRLDDEQGAEDEGELYIGGTIAVDGVTPVKWSVLLWGKLAGKLLTVVLPSQVAQAKGLIEIDGKLVLSGDGPRPTVSGSLLLDQFSISPRGVRRELTFNTGSVEIETSVRADPRAPRRRSCLPPDVELDSSSAGSRRTYALCLDDVQGTLDDGKLSNVAGWLLLRDDGELVKARLGFDATSIPFRLPQTLDLVVSASDIQLVLDEPGANWRATGAITVIDGAYIRNVELTDRLQAIGVNTAPSKPFWEEYPKLGSTELDLTLVVQLFAVRNNIAPTIEFRSDGMRISGTPRDPRLAGQIRVTHGEFKIPGTRASFARTTGTVDFAENQRAGDPELHVASDADYRDLSGQDHVITLTIGGTLQQATWDLKTSTGYNKSQTLSLLFLGRNQEQLRRSLGDQNLGGDPTRTDPTTNPSQGFADQIVKDLAGDWVSDLLGNSLTKLTGLDVLRIEIGFGSIGVHIEKKVLENAKIVGDAEQTIRGTTIKGRAELKTPFVISLQGGYLNQNYYDPAEQSIEDFNVKLVYRLFIP